MLPYTRAFSTSKCSLHYVSPSRSDSHEHAPDTGVCMMQTQRLDNSLTVLRVRLGIHTATSLMQLYVFLLLARDMNTCMTDVGVHSRHLIFAPHPLHLCEPSPPMRLSASPTPAALLKSLRTLHNWILGEILLVLVGSSASHCLSTCPPI